MKKTFSLIVVSVIGIEADILEEAFSKSEMNGQLRFGAIQVENATGDKSSTLTLGGKVGVKTKSVNGVSVATTFYTTNALFGKDRERMFLNSNNDSYSIMGEAYIQADLGKTTLKAGRQIVDTPFADSDDVGMIPNTFEGVTLVNQDLAETTLLLASLDKWAGVDTATPEKFNQLQASGDAVLMAGLIYEGIENTTLQTWHYKLDKVNFNYFEAGYETKRYNLSAQYTTQDNGNSSFGLRGGTSFGDLLLTTAYNKVKGRVTNGFGGGPFFTSSEAHTIEVDELNQKAIFVGAEYAIDRLTLAFNHANFEKGENDTDYIVSYTPNKNNSLNLIYSDMYADGNMLRFFANYNF